MSDVRFTLLRIFTRRILPISKKDSWAPLIPNLGNTSILQYRFSLRKNVHNLTDS